MARKKWRKPESRYQRWKREKKHREAEKKRKPKKGGGQSPR